MQLDPNKYFLSDYYSSRERFLGLAQKAGLVVSSQVLDQSQNFFIDIAHNIDSTKSATLVHIAGTHGVEGILGNAIQNYIFENIIEGKLKSTTDLGLVFVHCLNPYGMQYGRQLTKENINLNRNFILDPEKFTGASEVYSALNSSLNPAIIPAFDLVMFNFKLFYLILRHGWQALKDALACGQYEYPQGLFFGGKELAAESKLLLSWLTSNLGHCKKIACLDIHSGLGPWGHDSLLAVVDAPRNLSGFTGAFSDRTIEYNSTYSVSYQTNGGLIECLPELFPKAQVHAIVQEFGTYHIFKVLRAIRLENSWYNFAKSQGLVRPSAAELTEIFCPSDHGWRQQILQRGLCVYQEFVSFLKSG